MKNILCLRPDNIGDVLMTEPALRALKISFPGAQLTLLTSSRAKNITALLPEIDNAIIFDLPWQNQATPLTDKDTKLTYLIRRLKKNNYDTAFIFTTYSQCPLPMALVCYRAGIPNVVAYCRENPSRLINHWVPDQEPYLFVRHEVTRQCALVEAMGATVADDHIQITVSPDAHNHMHKKLHAWGTSPGNAIVLHAGGREKKRFSSSSLVEVGRLLVKKGYQLLLTGTGKEEKRIALKIKKAVGTKALSLVDRLSLDEFIALIDRVPLLITNKTGPAQIAAAVQTPVVVLYARTNPQHMPWKVPSRVLCFDVNPKLYSKNQILVHTYPHVPIATPTPEEIVEAALQLLADLRETPPVILWQN